MRQFLIACAVIALTGCASISSRAPANGPAPQPQALIATWNVALQFDPASPPSKTEMVVSATKDGACEGSFYGTPMQTCRVIVRGREVIFAAVTADQSGPYFHSGRLGPDGAITGQTLAQGRNFLMNWTAQKS
jgi:hypothetical protein